MRGAHETPHGWSWLVNTSIYSGIRSTERSSRNVRCYGYRCISRCLPTMGNLISWAPRMLQGSKARAPMGAPAQAQNLGSKIYGTIITLSDLSVFHSESVLRGAFAWVRCP